MARTSNGTEHETPLLEARGLVKFYGAKKVVKGVSFRVRPAEVVGLLGPNGAGKTTSFFMCLGQVRPDDGTILLGGQNVTQVPTYKRARLGMSYLAQEASIFRRMTVEQNVLAVLEVQVLSKAERIERAHELLEKMDIMRLRTNRAETLSGGERRRLEIARALATDPALILLDEPFAGVDPIAVEDIQRVVLDLKRDGIGILLTDHNVRETLSITDRAYIISDGTILREGTPTELIHDPKVRQTYLGEGFQMPGVGVTAQEADLLAGARPERPRARASDLVDRSREVYERQKRRRPRR